MDLIFNISEIAIITGDNIYKTKRDYLIDFWKKYDKNDYEKYVKITKFIKETDKDIVKKISVKNNIDNIEKDLLLCSKTKNINDMNQIKQSILDKINILPENEKKEITKSINNIANTNFGIKNENDITKIYENITGNTIVKDNKYIKKIIYENDKFNIIIGGKIDGINYETGSIIEIKNRMNKLFYNLREYEKVQIMCYIYLFESLKGDLVEAFKRKDNTTINIIQVDFDQNYMNNIILKLILFSNYFYDFISNNDMKINLLKNSHEIIFFNE